MAAQKPLLLSLLFAVLLSAVPLIFVDPALPSPLKISAEFSAQPPGASAPLITTGSWEAGDFLFVRWIAENKIVFCYNSWGDSRKVEGEPVEIEPGQKLDLEIVMPSLGMPPEYGVPTVSVSSKGRSLLEKSPAHFHACARTQATFGENRFGNMLCEPSLPGALFRDDGTPLPKNASAYYSWTQKIRLNLPGWGWLPLLVLFSGPACAFARKGRRLLRILFRPSALQAHGFLFGLGISFLLLSLAGKKDSQEAKIDHFKRFHFSIRPDSYFYVTGSMLLNTALDQIQPGQTVVVIGGSSILYGTCQPPDKIWSEALKKDLGSHYCVINTGLPTSYPTGPGSSLVEILRARGHKVIYVADIHPNGDYPPDGRDLYKYIFWDLYYKNLLPPFPERDAFFKSGGKDVDAEKRQDARIAMFFNSFFHSMDLWNNLAYSRFFTLWTPQITPFYQPRRLVEDNEPDAPPLELRYRVVFDEEMKHLRAGIAAYYPDAASETLDIPDQMLSASCEKLENSFKPEHRALTVFVMTGVSLHHRSFLSDLQQKRLQKIYSSNQEFLRLHGFQCHDLSNLFAREDYGDYGHLTPSGGEKLARKVAEIVRNLNAAQP